VAFVFISIEKRRIMKSFILGIVFCLVSVPAFAGSCPCERAATVTKSVVATTKEVVKSPVRVVRGLRARVAANRAVRLQARSLKAE
jgi:cell shape-determining protein MreC